MSTTPIILPGSRPPRGWTYERRILGMFTWKCLLRYLWFFKVMFLCGFIKIRIVPFYDENEEMRKDFGGIPLGFEILQFFVRNPLLVPEDWAPDDDEVKRVVFFTGDEIRNPNGEIYYPYLRIFRYRPNDWWVSWEKGDKHPFYYVAVI